MWDLIVSAPDHCLSFYFEDDYHYNRQRLDRHMQLNIHVYA